MQAGLLTLLHPRVPRQEAVIAKGLEIVLAVGDKGSRQGHANCSRLAGQTSATHANNDINPTRADVGQRLKHQLLVLHRWEEFFQRSAVDQNFSGTRTDTHSSHRALTTTGAKRVSINLVFFDGYHRLVIFQFVLNNEIGFETCWLAHNRKNDQPDW